MILIDVHEESERRRLLGDLAFPEALDAGDYQWFGWTGESWGVEFKTLANLLSSISTDQLPFQATKMAVYDIPLILIEGLPHLTNDGRIILWSWRTVAGKRSLVKMPTEWRYLDIIDYLISLWWCLGIMHLWSDSMERTAAIIRRLYEWSQKPEHGAYLWRKTRVELGSVPPSQRVLSEFPLVGREVSENLLKARGNLAQVLLDVLFEPETLQGIPLVGSKRIEKIKEVLLEEYGEELSKGEC